MPTVYVYDTKDLNATDVIFFDKARVSATNKEVDTNMPKEKMLDFAMRVKKILVLVPPQVKASGTAKDTTVLDSIKNLIDGVITIQVGDRPVLYLPLFPALCGVKAEGDVEYTLASAADGSYALASIGKHAGEEGLPVDFDIPANTTIDFHLKFLSAPNISRVKVVLVGEKA